MGNEINFTEVENSEERKCGETGSKERFRQELDRWFRERGIMADLRSHLRYSMIMALQGVADASSGAPAESSPKAQAVNLLVAEFLSKRGCHYTLSVFSSEVPTLASFARRSPGCGKSRRNKPLAKTIIRDATGGKGFLDGKSKKNRFQIHEVEEIFNALGIPAKSNEVETVKSAYFRNENDDSLLDLILQWSLQLAIKMDVRETIESQNESRRIPLSGEWNSGVLNVLVREKIDSVNIALLQKDIARVTEAELERVVREERKKNIELLAEREKRIQETIKAYEKKILQQLERAEEDLNKRKDAIEEELTERQRHLAKIMMEWNAKHEHIVRLAKKFYKEKQSVQKEKKKRNEEKNENAKFQDPLQTSMTKKNTDLKDEEEKAGTNNDGEKDFVSESESAEVAAKSKSGNDEFDMKSSEAIENLKPSIETQVSSTNLNGLYFEECSGLRHEDSSASESSSSEKIISSARKKFHELEEKTTSINRTYFECKRKYASWRLFSDSEPSTVSSKGSKSSEHHSPQPDLVLSYSKCKFSQTDIKNLNFSDDIFESSRKKAHAVSETRFSVDKTFDDRTCEQFLREPTKRQQKNRDFFLKTRKLLQEMKDDERRMKTIDWSSSNSSPLDGKTSPCREDDGAESDGIPKSSHSDQGNLKSDREDLGQEPEKQE